ncbi:MAG: GGDEF domain-containing protein [Oscillospiraceae bacterium]
MDSNVCEAQSVLTELVENDSVSERYRALAEHTGTIMFEWSPYNQKCYTSTSLPRLFAGNYNDRDIINIWLSDEVVHPEDRHILQNAYTYDGTNNKIGTIHIRLKAKSGCYLWCQIGFYLLFSNNTLIKMLGILNDEDEAVCSRQILEYRALYDTLTGIYNAQSFYAKAHQMMHKNSSLKYALLRCDISRFKFINELYGMDEGDKVLCRVAAELDSKSSHGVCGRVGNDIFAMCISYDEKAELVDIIQTVSANVTRLGPGCVIHTYFGICLVDNINVPVNVLCDRAGLALSQIKGSLLSNYAYYDNALRAKELSERNTENEMENALANGEFIVYLQPKHSLVSGKPIGAEALVRWQHPRNGLLAPVEFVPLFERNGFIVKLDEFVWETVFICIRKWLNDGKCPVPVSVNVSRKHIYSPDFVERVTQLMQKYDIPGYLIELELTESTFVDNQDELYSTLEGLQKKGLNFSIDDFGSGYSSLNMLRNSTAEILKLDREFLSATADDEKAQAVVRHTISMANELNMQVVAEGVETKGQADFLKSAGCLAAQGYFYSKPMPISEFEELMIY